MEKEIELCLIFKIQPLKMCFHSNKVNTSSHYRPSSFLLVSLKIFFKNCFKSLVKNNRFSDHLFEPETERNHTWSIDFLMLYGSWLFMVTTFSERSLTSYPADYWGPDLVSLVVIQYKHKLFAVFKQKSKWHCIKIKHASLTCKYWES